MIEITQANLEELAAQAGVDEEALTFDYSGRYMYGATCFGIRGDINEVLRFVATAGVLEGQGGTDEEMWGRIVDALADGGCRTDSLGLGIIYYWPRISVVGEEET